MSRRKRAKLTLFPDYIVEPRYREMAYLRTNEIITQSGEVYPVHSAGEIWAVVNEYELSPLFISDFLNLPEEWVLEFLELGEINCDKRGKPLSQRLLLSDHTTRWIQSSQPFGYPVPGSTFLSTLALVQRKMGVGSIGSPGAMGISKLKQSFSRQYGRPEYTRTADGSRELREPGWLAHRHARPNAYCCAQLRARGTGARSELCTLEKNFESLIELDMKNAYGAALAQPLPAGKDSRFYDGDIEGYADYVAECQVTIKEPLIYGLFPVKDPETGLSSYPTQPGVYSAWCWKQRVELLQTHGLEVEIGDGFGWYTSTTDCAAFVKEMEELRDTAETEQEAGMYKLCLVAAIGALGMEGPGYVLTKEEGINEMLRVCLDSGQVTTYFLKEKKKRSKSMPHWMWCVLERVNCWLTEEAYRWMKQEMLVATNTDAVLLKNGANISMYPSKILLEDTERYAIPSGSWRARTLHKVTIPALRHLIATGPRGEKIDKRPGVPNSKRT